ncbi:hypothetical protein KEM54_001196 [Ascosphaera aggregata]|nr:hypothetical protein KEM54_001196 [Ascosphaera aggregata]
MSRRPFYPDEYELVARSSEESRDSFDLDEDDFEAQATPTATTSFLHQRPSFLRKSLALLPIIGIRLTGIRRSRRTTRSGRSRSLRRCISRQSLSNAVSYHLIATLLHWTSIAVLVLVIFTGLFRPSYTHPPAHYISRRNAIGASSKSGRGNPSNETVFVAASLYDPTGEVVRGGWGDSLLQLIDFIGKDNVFLSIYENNSGEKGKSALSDFEKRLACNKSIVSEASMNAEGVGTINLPDGTKRVKRIAYLAEVRNRALHILDRRSLPRFDRLLYINDIVFDPVDALNLLFSTNVDTNGVARYRAACATDFINAFKFYDTFATRDLDGYSMGVPFYPWFTTMGRAESRQDVIDQRDAVRVRSCWGGMVAFDASFFQPSSSTPSPARFRAENDTFWDASECCLIHADIQIPPYESSDPNHVDTGIYMNPFIRVAYDSRTLFWLGFTRRFERLYSPIQRVVNSLAGLPRYNPRRTERAGETVKDVVYAMKSSDGKFANEGTWKADERIAGTGGFCGRRGVQVMIEHPEEGRKNWENLEVPSGAPNI